MKDVINANFVIGVNKSVSGTLELGSNKFKCWSTDFFHVQPHSNIYGTTHKGQPISLLNCLSFKETQYSGGNTRNCSGDLFSHTMLLGDKHIKPDEDLFDSISLVVKNPLKLFQDVKSFGYIQFPKEGLIEALNEEEFTPHFTLIRDLALLTSMVTSRFLAKILNWVKLQLVIVIAVAFWEMSREYILKIEF